ncbi:MAG: hypothetical protein LBO67_01385 [Spirochaetaceae bacterium]|jgi:hypothetical protein|nr:hypothetical protein [Spirochaetaceae bacterium]
MQQTSAAVQIIIAIIPIVGIVMGSVVVFFYIFWNHKHTELLIKSGLWVKPHFNLTAFCLLTGLLLSTVGLALTVFLSIVIGSNLGLLGGIIPLALGIGLLAYYWIVHGTRT